jgi:hypothetical protein
MKSCLNPEKAFRFADSDYLLVKILIVLALFALRPAPSVLSQIPQGFTYQALAFDNAGELIRNTALPVRISIESDSLSGTLFWQELHSTVTTNASGLFSLVLGKGVKQLGDAATFADIDWSVTPKFIRTEIDYGGWKTLGASRLWSVPYAMSAGDLTGSLKKLEVVGETSVMDEALFEVKNKNGQTVFAVYNEGVRVNVGNGENKAVKGGFAIGSFDETKLEPKDLMVVTRDSVRVYIYDDPLNKAVKGGFAIGGFDETKGLTYDYMLISPDSIRMYIDQSTGKAVKGGFAIGGFDETKAPLKEFLRVSPDSVRVYIDRGTGKAVKGGFAIGGFDETKAPSQDYLRVTHDSIRMYITNDPSKAVKGGFAIGSFDETKSGPVTGFTSLTPENYYIGHQSGGKNTTGRFNSVLGYEAGLENTGGSRNVFIGYRSGYLNTSGESNTFLGHMAGFSNSTGYNNVFLGDSAGYSNSEGKQNIFLGNGSGKANISGEHNSFIGYQSGYKNQTGLHNAFIGYQAGFTNETGDNNSFIGYQAGYYTFKGSRNIFIGYRAGYYNYGITSATGQPGNNNIYVGESAGAENISGNANVYIGLEAGKGNEPDYVSPPRYNVYIGYQTGYKEFKGAWNTFIGYQAGYNNSTGSWSTFIGYQAGYNHLTGNYNTMIGYQAGVAHQTGGNNTIIGNYAGYRNVAGTGNVFIGYQAGYNTFDSNILQISNSKNDSLIFGNFSTRVVRINNKLGIGITPGATTQALEVSGNGRFTSLAGTGNRALYVDPTGILTLSASDIRLKENIAPIGNALTKVMALQGVTYSWRNDPEGLRNIGFIAQEVEKVLPELVFTNPSDGMKGINYAEMTAVLTESVKEQQKIIQDQNEQIRLLESLLSDTRERLDQLEQLISGKVPDKN